MKIPQIAGEWRVLFKPEKHGNYVNDHTIVRGADGKWHLYGCTSTTGNPYDERYFIHGVGDDLSACFKEVGRSVDRGTLAWSPCVIEKDGDYYMLYGPSPTSLSVSFDMYEWFNHTVTLQNEPLMAAHRDHFVLRLENGRYLMYVSGGKIPAMLLQQFSVMIDKYIKVGNLIEFIISKGGFRTCHLIRQVHLH